MKGQEETTHAIARQRLSRVLRYARTTIFCAFAAVGLFAVGFALFADHVSRLVTPSELDRADAIIVLTGGQSRVDAAVDLLRSGKGKRLLISGVNPIADRDDLRAATGGDPDLFACCVDIDHAALDTIGNAEESAKWVTSHAYGKVIVVTNNYHMPRSLLEMRRFIGSVELMPYPVVNTRLDNGSWMTRPDAVRVMFTEYAKFVAALARGMLPSASHPVGVMSAAAAG